MACSGQRFVPVFDEKTTERTYVSLTREPKLALSQDGVNLRLCKGAFMQIVEMGGKVARFGKGSVFRA